jgi:hypothetical protein
MYSACDYDYGWACGRNVDLDAPTAMIDHVFYALFIFAHANSLQKRNK